MRKSLGIQVWMATQYHHQTNGQVERRIRTLKQLMRNFVNPRQNNWSGALPAIAPAMNGAPHESLAISPYNALHGRSWKIFNPVQRSASKVPAMDNILNAHEATRMEVDMARKHATFRQTVQADKFHKPLTESCKNASRVLVRGRRYTSSPGGSKKLEPPWFGPFKVLEHLPDTDKYKLHLPPRVRYGTDGDPKSTGPMPFSTPRPTQPPGAGCLFPYSLPLSPLRPRPHPYPRRVPVKNRW